MSKKLPISVVIPALNAERFIGAAIESVHAQTLQVSEIIVVDNGCTDRTAEIASHLGAVVIEERERGLSRARNAGIQRATQDWVALLDSDDLWDPQKVEAQWSAIRTFPKAGLVGCYFRAFEGDTVVLEESDEVARDRWNGYRGEATVAVEGRYFPKVEPEFFPRYLPSCSDAMLKREVFSAVGLFDEAVLYNEDFELFMRVLARYPLALVEKTLISCRRHDRKHSRNVVAMRDSVISIVNHMLAHPDNYPPGAPQVYRDRIKENFLIAEQAIQGQRKIDQEKADGA